MINWFNKTDDFIENDKFTQWTDGFIKNDKFT